MDLSFYVDLNTKSWIAGQKSWVIVAHFSMLEWTSIWVTTGSSSQSVSYVSIGSRSSFELNCSLTYFGCQNDGDVSETAFAMDVGEYQGQLHSEIFNPWSYSIQVPALESQYIFINRCFRKVFDFFKNAWGWIAESLGDVPPRVSRHPATFLAADVILRAFASDGPQLY